MRPGPCCAGCAASETPSRFLALIDSIRALAPLAGIRSNVICGFPGETDADLAVLLRFPQRGPSSMRSVFSATPTRTAPKRPGTDGQLSIEEIEARRAGSPISPSELISQRAEDRIGKRSQVLVEQVGTEDRRPGSRTRVPRLTATAVS